MTPEEMPTPRGDREAGAGSPTPAADRLRRAADLLVTGAIRAAVAQQQATRGAEPSRSDAPSGRSAVHGKSVRLANDNGKPHVPDLQTLGGPEARELVSTAQTQLSLTRRAAR